MFERTSKHNQVSESNSSTNGVAKTTTLENLNHEQNHGLLFNNSIVMFCKENIKQQNDFSKKGLYVYTFRVLELI